MSAVTSRLFDAASWCAGVARAERCPADRLWIDFVCAACGRERAATFRYPSDGASARSLGAIWSTVGGALTQRPVSVDEHDFDAARACPCGAPAHHRRTVAAALLRPMIGTGSLFIALEALDGQTMWRLDDGAATPLRIEDPRQAFGRPLALFEPLASIEVTEGTLALGEGAWLVVGSDAASLSTLARARLGDVDRVVVRLDAGSAQGAPALAAALEAGLAIALIVAQAQVLQHARAWARARLGADVRALDGARLELVTERGCWPIAVAAVALDMAQRGVVLAEACARALADASDALDDRLETLRALVALAPGASFDVEGHLATPRAPDGAQGAPVALAALPAGLHGGPIEELAREAAFYFDAAPPWADRRRVCPCGAAARVELRAVPWPWNGSPSEQPWAVERAADRAVVIALSCDRHVRILPESALRRMNLSLEGGG